MRQTVIVVVLNYCFSLKFRWVGLSNQVTGLGQNDTRLTEFNLVRSAGSALSADEPMTSALIPDDLMTLSSTTILPAIYVLSVPSTSKYTNGADLFNEVLEFTNNQGSLKGIDVDIY